MRRSGLESLKGAYQAAGSDTFGLYLGAGVNLHPEGKERPGARFKTYCWQQLLEELYKRNRATASASLAELWARYGDDWQGLASALVGSLPVDEFVGQIDEILHEGIPRKDNDGRLSVRVLDQAPTLRAALCFSTRVRKRTATSWTFERNPKVSTVITTNYDFFFGAGWTRYQAFRRQWKVQTPLSEGEVRQGQGTIGYIHGYVPYRLRAKKDLVLTRESYASAYAPEGFAVRTLREAIERRRLVFVGTSFADLPLREALAERGDGGRHFALVKSSSEAARRAEQLGLCRVVVQDYGEIPEVLREVYCAGLGSDELVRVGLESSDAYWERLAAGPVK